MSDLVDVIAAHKSGVESLAQVCTDVRYTREHNEPVRRELLGALRRQGFQDGAE